LAQELVAPIAVPGDRETHTSEVLASSRLCFPEVFFTPTTSRFPWVG